MGNIFYTLFVLAVASFFLVLGAIGLSLPWSAGLQLTLLHFFTSNWIVFSLMNLSLVVIGLSVLALLFSGIQRKTFHIRFGKKGLSIHRDVVQNYLETYWKRIFPHHEVPFRFVIKRQIIQIYADLPYTPENQQEVLMEKIQQDCNEIFFNVIGYQNDIDLSLSFPEEEPTARSFLTPADLR